MSAFVAPHFIPDAGFQPACPLPEPVRIREIRGYGNDLGAAVEPSCSLCGTVEATDFTEDTE